jgi:hypothetical protein
LRRSPFASQCAVEFVVRAVRLLWVKTRFDRSNQKRLFDEKPLFDVVTEWALREENGLIAIPLGLGMFSGGIFWLLWALR